MTLVYNSALSSFQPQTHVLIIGVNEYPHLRNGHAFSQSPSPVTLGLGQLTSPVVSAIAFANWMIEHLNNPEAPLGTVELLLSPHQVWTPPKSASTHVESAIFSNIKTAFNDWYTRCDQSQDNVAMFYFCGHGMEYDRIVLLPEDFGSDAGNPWDTAIDFHKTWMGMADCKSETQCYFLDTCRDVSFDILKTHGYNPRALRTPQTVQRPPRAAPILKATTPGGQAQAQPGAVSYFTQALIDCLSGLGAERKARGNWVVSAESISSSVIRLMKYQGRVGGHGGEVNISPTQIHLIPDPAKVIACISCSPEHASGDAELKIRRPGTTSPIYQCHPPAPNPWKVIIDTGCYDLEAHFQNGMFLNVTEQGQIVYPPWYDYEFSV